MAPIDWIIVILYIAAVMGMGFIVGRLQKSQEDYYLGGRKMPFWMVTSSLMANQVSAISLIGAPAFIAAKKGGGLRWLQYELAVPLAMIVIILFLVPVFWKTGGITIYAYMEKRFGRTARSLLSLLFLVSRSLGSGVALLAASYVTSVCTGAGLVETILLVGVLTLIYTSVGGLVADIYSDVLQLAVLWAGSLVCLYVILQHLGGGFAFPAGGGSRLVIFDTASSGWGDGETFSLWPMLFGGFFLYVSYYGCDQSQAQRLLSTATPREAQKALLWNGILRFPLVLTYCAAGVLMIPFLSLHPGFAREIESLPADYLMPLFFTRYVPAGFLGVIIAGIFAASMSTLDSAINSLSAATWVDFLCKIFPGLDKIPERRQVTLSRLLSALWGILATGFAVSMAGGPETVIELVNKIGSAFYGPVAGIFVLGLVSARAGEPAALSGMVTGMVINLCLWIFLGKEVSWMWWNVTGFLGTLGAGTLAGFFSGDKTVGAPRAGILSRLREEKPPLSYVWILALWFGLISAFCLFWEKGMIR